MVDEVEDAVLRARGVQPGDEDARWCWELVVRGIELGWLDQDELDELRAHLADERDYGVEELLFAHLFTDAGTRLRVSFLSETYVCEPAALIASLDALARSPR